MFFTPIMDLGKVKRHVLALEI